MAAVRTARQPFAARPGFLLLEALIGFALLALFMTAVGLTVLVSQQGTSSSAQRARAIALSTAALDGVRLLRSQSWSSLPTGIHGITAQDGVWTFSGTGTVTDGFTTGVTLTELDEGRMGVTAETTWSSGQEVLRVSVDTELTDWRTPKAVGNWAAPQVVGSWTTGDTPLFNRVSVSGDIAAVTSDVSAGGAGLYLFDLQNPSSPTRLASGFTLGFAGHDVLIAADVLYVITEDPAAELRVYDISDPSGFSSLSLLGSYDLPGDARARSLSLRGTTLAVGAQVSAGEDEVYLLDVSAPQDPVMEGAFSLEGGAAAADFIGGTLFIATDDDVAELRYADVTDPAAPSAPTGSGYNLTDVTDAAVVAATGTAAVIGRLGGAFTEELVLFAVSDGGLEASGPWYWEVGDSVNGFVLDPSQRYGFAATAYAGREFSVVDLPRWRGGLSAIVASMASTTGEGRGVFYDPAADRAYHVTRSTFTVYRPS